MMLLIWKSELVGFWNQAQGAFFDVRVFHPNASSNHSMSLQSAFCRHEQAKKREYGKRVREIEHGVFTPLVLFTIPGLGIEATTFYKHLAAMSHFICHSTMCNLRASEGVAPHSTDQDFSR